MTQVLTKIFERVKTWPAQRQEDVVQMIEAMEKQGTDVYHLSDEEKKEVEAGLREIAAGDIATDEEVTAVFKKYGL